MMKANSASSETFVVLSSKGKILTKLTQRQVRRIKLYAEENNLTPAEMISRAIDFALEDNVVEIGIPDAITVENEEEFRLRRQHGNN